MTSKTLMLIMMSLFLYQVTCRLDNWIHSSILLILVVLQFILALR